MSEDVKMPELPPMPKLEGVQDRIDVWAQMQEYARQYGLACWRAGMEQSEQDAKRYRRLRDSAHIAFRHYPMLQWHLPQSYFDYRTPAERLDASIDAAIEDAIRKANEA